MISKLKSSLFYSIYFLFNYFSFIKLSISTFLLCFIGSHLMSFFTIHTMFIGIHVTINIAKVNIPLNVFAKPFFSSITTNAAVLTVQIYAKAIESILLSYANLTTSVTFIPNKL